MNDVLRQFEKVAEVAVKQVGSALEGEAKDTVNNKTTLREGLNVLREYARLYSAQTARANVAVKMAGALGLKKHDLLPVWNHLTGQQITNGQSQE